MYSLYNNRKLGNTNIEEVLGINIDYYFELLPLDIQENYKTKHITLAGEVSSMLEYIVERIVEITREAALGNGRVDFKLYKNSNEDEKVLIEIKRASSSYLKKGYEK